MIRGARSILFVELLGGIGDLLMSLPAIHALRSSHPTGRISVFTLPPGADLLTMDPAVDEVLVARRGTDAGLENPRARQDLAALLAARSFDLVVSDTRYAGIHTLVEQSTSGRAVTQLWEGAGQDEPIERLFLRRLVEEGVIDARYARQELRLPVGREERLWADGWWRAVGLPRRETVILNPDSGMPIKRWPESHFVELGRALRQAERPVVVMSGGAPAAAETIAASVPGSAVTPLATLRRLAGLLGDAGAFVSADTGPAKLAAAVGTPVVEVFGPTWAGRYGQPTRGVALQSPFECPELNPMNFTLQRCWFTGRCIFPGKANCCEDVRPAQVLEAVERVVGRRAAGGRATGGERDAA